MSIFTSILSFVSDTIKPITKLIDDVSTSKEEKQQLKNELAKIEASFTSKLIELRKSELEAQSRIITSEAKGESWLQRNWRPITMLLFVGLIISRWFGLTIPNISPELESDLYSLIKIGLGGYVIGRSVEKISPKISDAIKSRNNK